MSSDKAPLGPRFSRRRALQAGAAVGGALWVAPAIESISTAAAAASAPSAVNFGCSWVYVIWKTDNTVNYTGWKHDTGTQCNVDSAYPATKVDVPGAYNGYSFVLIGKHGAPPEIDYTPPSGPAEKLKVTTDGCSHFTYSGDNGRTITSDASVEILGAYSFGGGSATFLEPVQSGVGNSLNVTCQGQ